MDKHITKFVNEQELQTRINLIGKLISEKHPNNDIVLLGLLKGSVIFLSDLARNISNPNLSIEFMVVKSYRDGSTTKNLSILLDLKKSIAGKTIIIVEDIVDTGRTIVAIKKMLFAKGARKVEIAALCSKSSKHESKINIDYPVFEVPDKIIVGMGLDYNERFRHLPYLGFIDEFYISKFKTKNI